MRVLNQTGDAGQTGRHGQAGTSGHLLDSILAAIATLTAAWPISTLLAQTTWLGGTVLLLAVIVGAGVGARSLALRSWQVLTVQLVCSVLAASALYGRGHLWYGLPTFDTIRFANTLLLEAVDTAQKYTAPAPATAGLVFVVGGSLGLVALIVDYLAVTRRTPSLAGLPLLTVFLAAVANRGSTLPFTYFLAAAGMWLILVARAGSSTLRWWGTTVAVPSKPVPYRSESRAGAYEHASTARVLGAVALVTAVTLPVVLPQLPPTFLLSGLGRNSTAPGNSSNTVEFSQSIDLATDLQSRSRAPVLQYTTADPAPPPLRVSLGAAYRPEPGVWLPFGRQWQSASGGADLSVNPRVPDPVGLSPDVPKRNFVIDVRRNLLEDPYLATPYPLVGADLGGTAWGADELTQGVRVAQRPETYKASYWHLNPTAKMLRSSTVTQVDPDPLGLDLRLDGPYVERVSRLTETLTTGKGSAYDKAMAIQEYLRSDGGFTYSLTLAPPAKDRFGNVAGYDSLTNFLVTKQGYCVQFATAMVMMSRAAGIPARMATGFLPGTQSKGVWTVLAADAHAWPELYLDGVGWTRFEPTPSRGAPPPYATPETDPSTAVDGTPLDSATTPAPSPDTRPELAEPSAGSGSDTEAGLSVSSAVRWATHGWGPVLLGTLLVLLGSLVVPVAARWRRRRSLETAATYAQGVEVRWELLTSSLGDLGIPPAPSRTPRQLQAHYDKEALLEEPASQALGRVVQTLERSRYAVTAPPDEGLEADTREVFRAAAANRRGRDRLRATLLPSSGVAQLRSVMAQVARRVRTGHESVSNLARRLSPRHRAPHPEHRNRGTP